MTPSDLSRMEVLAERAEARWHAWLGEEKPQFIAASRLFVPQAIEEIRKQRAEIERLRALVKRACFEGCARVGEAPQHVWDNSNAKRALEGSE